MMNYRQTSIYAPGAGLGASKGKDISKMTEFGGYVGMAKDSVSVGINILNEG